MTAAHVAHATRGRARLRLPSVKGDAGLFQRLADELRRCRGVTSIRVNAATGSVLLHHRGNLEDVMRQAREQGIIDIVEQEPTAEPLEALREKLFEANDALRSRTKNTADLRTIAFGALLGGSAYQLLRGDFLPAGGTMLLQAVDILLGFRTIKSDE